MIALLLVRRRAVNNSADLSEKKEIKEGVCVWYISIHFVFAFFVVFFFFSFCYRRCGSVKVKLVLNFSMELNSVYTILQSIYWVFLS